MSTSGFWGTKREWAGVYTISTIGPVACEMTMADVHTRRGQIQRSENQMKFLESRLLGVHIDKTGQEVVLSLVDTTGARFDLELHGVEKLLVDELRQQNVVEEMIHWTKGTADSKLRGAAFYLMTGGAEDDCRPELATVANSLIARVVGGEVEVLEITAIFGAQVLAAFGSMTIRPVPN